MAFNLVIQGPPAFLILAGIGFLIFNDETTGWVLIFIGAVLLIILTWISTTKKTVVVQQKEAQPQQTA